MGRSSKGALSLRKELRNRLIRAVEEGRLRDSIASVHELVRLANNGEDEVIAVPPGPRNFHRNPELPHFTRDDGAWFDFAITLRAGEVVAWGFELRFPDDVPPWVRFDLNPPDHDNADRGMRCHVHPGCDDDGMAIPYTECAPLDVLELVLEGLRRTGRVRGR